MGQRVTYNINREPVKTTLPLFELIGTDDVFKDDLNKDIKDLVSELQDSRTAFKIVMVLFLLSFFFNIILCYELASKAYSPAPDKTSPTYSPNVDTTFLNK